MGKIKDFFLGKWPGNILFWSWNTVAVLFITVFVTPFIAYMAFGRAFAGMMPWDFAFFIYLANLTIIGSVILVAIKLRKTPEKIMGFFYGVEMPLLFLCILRVAFFRELGPSSAFLLALLILAIAAYLAGLLMPGAGPEKNAIKAGLGLALRAVNLFIMAYLCLMLLFYIFPFTWEVLKGIFGFQWLQSLIEIMIQTRFSIIFAFIVWLFFAFFTSTVFILMPFAMSGLFFSHFIRGFRDYTSAHNRAAGLGIALAVIIACGGITALLNLQPQAAAFKLLEKPAKTAAEKAELVKKSGLIRDGLMNAYLSAYRYLSPAGENNHISAMYEHSFKMPEAGAEALQGIYNILAAPFLYDGADQYGDMEKAEEMYAKFFDAPIQKAEKDAVLHAMNSTWDRGGIEAGLLNINEKYVFLEKQEVTVTAGGAYSEVEIHEVYRNETYDPQEVMYYFDLPPDSVITGMYLNNDGNPVKRFRYAIAPRGAAQKVYKAQVVFRRDPSLLEQVGPTQYRLRAFPVPQKGWTNAVPVTGTAAPVDRLHIWITYRTMDKKTVVPVLLEKRNVYWNSWTMRVFNGKKLGGSGAWMPYNGAIKAAAGAQPEKFDVDLGKGIVITASKAGAQTAGKLPAVDVIIDGSYSMGEHKKQLMDELKILSGSGAVCRFFFGGDMGELKDAGGVKDAVFFGDESPSGLLTAYIKSGLNKGADIAVFTDDGGYEMQGDKFRPVKTGAPVWFVHVGGKKPYAYSDGLLETILQNGGTAVQGSKALIAAMGSAGGGFLAAEGGYEWRTGAGAGGKTQEGLEPLATRMYIYELMRKMNTARADNLDKLHNLAKEYSIVTPYSSMIVLVNEEQEKELKKASISADRFNRTVETGKEELSPPGNPLAVSSVPEPHEWALIICVALLLAAAAVMKRKRI